MYDLKELKLDRITVQGTEMALEDKVTGKVYVSNKEYMDKLFKEMGYKNLNVIKILEEYAGKFVSDIGSLTNSSVFVDETDSSFVVTSEKAVNWITDLFDRLEINKIKVLRSNTTSTCHIWDEFEVESSTGSRFAIYIDYLDEYARVFSLSYDKDGTLTGVVNEGKYEFSEEDSLESLIILLTSPVDISILYQPEVELSLAEYLDLLCKVGIYRVKRKRLVLTEKGESLDVVKNGYYEGLLDSVADQSWIQRHIKGSGKTFADGCRLITENLIDLRFWDLRDYYSANEKESSDVFALGGSFVNKI